MLAKMVPVLPKMYTDNAYKKILKVPMTGNFYLCARPVH